MSAQKKWSAWRPVLIGFIGIAVLFGGFGTWSVVSNIAGAIIASGRIEVDRNRQVVQHDSGGTISDILVDEGDLLLQLDPEQARSELTLIEGQLFELMARRGRLEAQRDVADAIAFPAEIIAAGKLNPDAQELMHGQSNLFFARSDSVAHEIEQLGKQRNQIEDQIDGISAQETALGTQLELIDQQLISQQKLLDQGLAQRSTVLSLQREKKRLHSCAKSAIASCRWWSSAARCWPRLTALISAHRFRASSTPCKSPHRVLSFVQQSR